jgi:hypothetical protein
VWSQHRLLFIAYAVVGNTPQISLQMKELGIFSDAAQCQNAINQWNGPNYKDGKNAAGTELKTQLICVPAGAKLN